MARPANIALLSEVMYTTWLKSGPSYPDLREGGGGYHSPRCSPACAERVRIQIDGLGANMRSANATLPRRPFGSLLPEGFRNA